MFKNYIRVYCRLKPNFSDPCEPSIDYKIRLNARTEEEGESESLIIQGKPSGAFINNKPDSYSFKFQKVFDEEIDQEGVYNEAAKPVVDGVLRGYNGTIFAYGQTGSGKTFTISGNSFEKSSEAIVHHSLKQMFKEFEHTSTNNYRMGISFMEIYNENGCDLLSEENDRRIILQEDVDGEIQLKNLSVCTIRNYREFLELYRMGESNRSESSTLLNQYSSRSHCILTIYLTVRLPLSQGFRRSKLHIVDLAGSERVSKSRINNQTFVEARHINLSLHYLEQVIVALGEKHRLHIPYRNSMMTTVLRDSLGGNCSTAMVATLATNLGNLEETLSTCRFAQRVALVKNEAKLNTFGESMEIEFLKSELQALKTQMSETSFKTVILSFKKRMGQNLSKEESLECQNFVDSFISNRSYTGVMLPIIKNPKKIKVCFELFRSLIIYMQKKRRKAEHQAQIMFQKVIESKKDGSFFDKHSMPRSAFNVRSSTIRQSSVKINSVSKAGLEYSKPNFQQSKMSIKHHTKDIKESKRPKTCTAHSNCVSYEIFEEKMNRLTDVIEECKEAHRRELNKLDTLHKLMEHNVIKKHHSLNDLLMKVTNTNLTHSRKIETENTSDNEILLSFDRSKEYENSNSKEDVSFENNIENENHRWIPNFEQNYSTGTVISSECTTAERNFKTDHSIVQPNGNTLPYSRNNPDDTKTKLTTSSEPVIKNHKMCKVQQVEDQTGAENDRNEQRPVKCPQIIQQRSKTATVSKKIQHSKSVSTNNYLESNEKIITQNTDYFSHYEGRTVRSHINHNCLHPTNRKNGNQMSDAAKNAIKNFQEKYNASKASTSPYIRPVSCSEQCCIEAAENNRKDMSNKAKYGCTHVSNYYAVQNKNTDVKCDEKSYLFCCNDSNNATDDMIKKTADFKCAANTDYNNCANISNYANISNKNDTTMHCNHNKESDDSCIQISRQTAVSNRNTTDDNCDWTPNQLISICKTQSVNRDSNTFTNEEEEEERNDNGEATSNQISDRIPNKTVISLNNKLSDFEIDDDRSDIPDLKLNYCDDEIPVQVLKLFPRNKSPQNLMLESNVSPLETSKIFNSKNICKIGPGKIRQKLTDVLPLTGDPEIDEEVILFYEKQIKANELNSPIE